MLERKIHEVMERKEVLRIPAEASVMETARQMVDNHVGAMLVCEGEVICGIFTERDMLERVVARGRAADATTVRDVMTPNPPSVTSHDTALDAIDAMKEHRARHLLVKDGDELVGIISMRDILRAALQEKAEEGQRFRHLWQGIPV